MFEKLALGRAKRVKRKTSAIQQLQKFWRKRGSKGKEGVPKLLVQVSRCKAKHFEGGNGRGFCPLWGWWCWSEESCQEQRVIVPGTQRHPQLRVEECLGAQRHAWKPRQGPCESGAGMADCGGGKEKWGSPPNSPATAEPKGKMWGRPWARWFKTRLRWKISRLKEIKWRVATGKRSSS